MLVGFKKKNPDLPTLILKTMQSETHIYFFWPKKHIRFMGSMWNLFDNQSLKDSQNSFDTGHSHMYQ